MERTNRYTVIVSDRARNMLAGHVSFLAQKNAAAARAVKATLIEALRSLSSMAERFPFLDAEYIPVNKYHKMLVGKWYLVLYQIKDQTVYVDYIVDGRQDYEWLVK